MSLSAMFWDQLLTVDRLVAAGQVILRVIVVLVLVRIGVGASAAALDKLIAGYKRGRMLYSSEARVNTIGALLKSVSRYTLYFVGLVWVLDALGIPAGSVIAAAGVGGLAVGFGAQNLVRDVISGFFILLEDQYAVGEFVSINGNAGVVAEVGLRSTRIQAYSGDVLFIANGGITLVVNHSRADMRSMIEVSIAYHEDHNRAIAVATEALTQLRQEVPYIVDGPKVMGINDLADCGVVLQIWAKATNGNQWALEREMRRVIKEAFDRAGIEIPFPHMVVVQRSEVDRPGAI